MHDARPHGNYFSCNAVDAVYGIMLEKEPSLEAAVSYVTAMDGVSRHQYESLIGEALMVERIMHADSKLFRLEFPVDRVIENGYLRMVPVFRNDRRLIQRVELRYKRGGTHSEIDALGKVTKNTGEYDDFIVVCEAKSGKVSSFTCMNFDKKMLGLHSFYDAPLVGLLHVTQDYRISGEEKKFVERGGKLIVCSGIKSTDIADAATDVFKKSVISRGQKKRPFHYI